MNYFHAQQTFAQIEQEFGIGAVPQIFKSIESQPTLLKHLWGQLRALVFQGDIPRTLKEMVGLVVAKAAHCDYIYNIYQQSLLLQNVDQQTLDAIANNKYEMAAVSHVTQAVLRYATLAIATRSASSSLTEHDWQLLRQQMHQALADTGLEDSEQLELIATIALFEQLCTVANLLQLTPDQP